MTTTATALGGTGTAAGSAGTNTNAASGGAAAGGAAAGAAGANGTAGNAAAGAQSGSAGAGTSGAAAQGQTGTSGDANGAPAKANESTPADITDITLKLPEGVKADAKLLEGFKAEAKALGLKSEGAQKVLDLYLDGLKRESEAGQKAWDDQQDGWVKALKTDKEYGGEKFEANLVTAKKAIEKFGGPELRKVMDETGLGNHPEVVRFMFRVGQKLAEDSIAGTGGTASQQATSEEARLKSMYPNSPQMFEGKR